MTGTNKTIAERLREASVKVGHCFTIPSIFGKTCEDFNSCRGCYEYSYNAIADAIEAEQDELRKQLDFQRDFQRERDCLCARIEELEKSQIPEGIQWPRFEDGALVKLGDEFVNTKGNTSTVTRIALSEFHYTINKGQGRICKTYGKPVKRPEPEVLDADGVPIKVGDTVYGQSDGKAWEVIGFDHYNTHCVIGECGGATRDLRPEWLSHKAPVLDADGMPIKVGDTVYAPGYFDNQFTVDFINITDKTVLVFAEKMGACGFRGDQLTHRKPDTQESIDDDATMPPHAYCYKVLNIRNLQTEEEMTIAMVRDLLTRQRKLMGGE